MSYNKTPNDYNFTNKEKPYPMLYFDFHCITGYDGLYFSVGFYN